MGSCLSVLPVATPRAVVPQVLSDPSPLLSAQSGGKATPIRTFTFKAMAATPITTSSSLFEMRFGLSLRWVCGQIICWHAAMEGVNVHSGMFWN